MITLVLKGLKLQIVGAKQIYWHCLNDYSGSKGIETFFFKDSPFRYFLNDYPGSKGTNLLFKENHKKRITITVLLVTGFA